MINGKYAKVQKGDTVRIDRESLHSVKALSALIIIEVQMGDKLGEDDIERFSFEWE